MRALFRTLTNFAYADAFSWRHLVELDTLLLHNMQAGLFLSFASLLALVAAQSGCLFANGTLLPDDSNSASP